MLASLIAEARTRAPNPGRSQTVQNLQRSEASELKQGGQDAETAQVMREKGAAGNGDACVVS